MLLHPLDLGEGGDEAIGVDGIDEMVGDVRVGITPLAESSGEFGGGGDGKEGICAGPPAHPGVEVTIPKMK